MNLSSHWERKSRSLLLSPWKYSGSSTFGWLLPSWVLMLASICAVNCCSWSSVNAVICAGPVPASWLLLAMSVKVTLLGVRVVSGVSGVCCLDLSSGVTGLAVPSGTSVSNISLSSDKSIESTFLVVPRSRSSVRQVSYVETQSNVKTGISHTRRSTTGNVLLGGSVLLALVRLSGCSVSSLAQAILPWDSIWNVSTA